MFTGIIEELGTVKANKPGILEVQTGLAGIKLGDSIAINGICLTARTISASNKGFSDIGFDASPETVSRTNLAGLKPGSKVNLERAMLSGGRFGGHMMTGHVEQTGKLAKIKKEGNSLVLTFSAPPDIVKYAVPKGSIGIDGISLTVVERLENGFSVSIIPHTFENTIFKFRKTGDKVNIEPDILAKYVENMLQSGVLKTDNLTEEFLKENGF